MDSRNVSIIHVFEVVESIADISVALRCMGDLENPGKSSGLRGTLRNG